MCCSTSQHEGEAAAQQAFEEVELGGEARQSIDGSLRPEIGSTGTSTPSSSMKVRPQRKSGTDSVMPLKLSISALDPRAAPGASRQRDEAAPDDGHDERDDRQFQRGGQAVER